MVYIHKLLQYFAPVMAYLLFIFLLKKFYQFFILDRQAASSPEKIVVEILLC